MKGSAWSINVNGPLENITDSLLTGPNVFTQKFRSLQRTKYSVLLQTYKLLLEHLCCSVAHLDADEVHPTFFGHSSGQQGFPSSRSSIQQYS